MYFQPNRKKGIRIMKKELRKVAKLCVAMFCGGWGSLKASLAKAFSLLKSEQAMPQKDNRGKCDLGFNLHQEHYRQVNLPSVLSSPNGEGNGINSITNLSPYRPIALLPKKVAFTMAEILLSLTIIGVVAAITLPSLTGNINERTWNTQRKALYSRLSQAVALMPNIRGYGSLTTVTAPENGVGGVYYASDAAETFLSAGLSKVFKLNNICDNSHLGDCGLPEYITNLTGGKLRLHDFSKWSDLQFVFSKTSVYGQRFTLDGATAAFETQNGESVLFFYHPLCLDFDTAAVYQRTNRPSLYVQNAYCANFIYDLNGKRGPNTVGKDVGYMTLLYPTERVLVAPVPLAKDVSSSTTFDNAKKLCSSNGEDIRLPNREELMAMKLNQKLFDNDMTFADTTHYSSTIGVIVGNDTRPYEWVMHSAGQSGPHAFLNLNVYSFAVRCVKR